MCFAESLFHGNICYVTNRFVSAYKESLLSLRGMSHDALQVLHDLDVLDEIGE